ncbi:Membrane carboxypeptidase (penicillin-binding protein) [Streptomyces sp. DvalAA-14]|uniref:transglycosylase domain-containing protein n=1 Tax=unclassified Streptomyces TaxID=2593676 RepID=UPI00081B953F|nr:MULTISPECIES: transglycosylase domain-containing protein [unclassified Streptomyces]MYS18831.1 penicillin-binding protein [Streptomyces sp. SID4948]SCD30121.1 Membrane carboxypeptidase (penicillin-binding protein) [Streptomyces sp. DvalAA-14]
MSDVPSMGTQAGWAPRPAPADREERTRRTGLRRVLPSFKTTVTLVLTGAALLIGAFFVGYALVSIPDANAAAVAQNNVYLYADGKTELSRDGAVNRQNVPLSEVAKSTQHAVLSAEDRNFYHESAVSPKSMLRAAWNTATGKGKQSGSTITQQYVKNYYLNQNQTASRKVKEFFIAIKLDRNETKSQILEGYLNTSYYGRNAYGIQAAAQAYFNKDAADLTTAEGAYLATLLNAPSEYDLAAHPENAPAAEGRWNYVLNGMVKEGWLTASQRNATTFPKIGKPKPIASKAGQRGYIIEAVNRYLTDHHIVDSDALAAGGYRIVTTIQKPKEDALVQAAEDNVYNKRGNTKADSYVRAGGVSIDPATSDVVALYGGIDYTKQYVSSATNSTYQPGSTFKPVILTSAVQNDSQTQDGETITPNTVYDGTNHRPVQGPNGPVGYAPGNEDGASPGHITVTRAMDQSVNAVFAQMAQDVGTSKVIDTAHDLGMPDSVDIPKTPAMALGAFGTPSASPLDMAQMYATLADHGKEIPYTLVVKVSKDGSDLSLPARRPVQAVPRTAADTTTSVLRSVVNSANGTAAAARNSGWPSAAKTGTAENDKAAWFAGYTPKLATVVAVLGMNPDTGAQESLTGALGGGRMNGGGPPGAVWAQYTGDALSGVPRQNFALTLADGAQKPPPSTEPPTTATTEPPQTTQPPTGTTQPPQTTQPPSTPPADPSTEPTPTDTATPPPTPTDTQTLNPIGGLTGGGTGGPGPGGGPTKGGGSGGTTGGTGNGSVNGTSGGG